MVGRQDTELVVKEFSTKRAVLESLCTKTKALIEQSLDEAGVRCQSVQARVKNERKLKSKYDDLAKGYRCLDDITDQAGLRVITYYEEEVDQVAEVIRREFDVRPEKSVDKRKTEPDRFGYYALHLVCTHLKHRTDIVEYKKFAGISFEIQITPILQHAWAEIEHDWYDLKADFPGDIKRRFSRLSAVLEVAGSEFTEIRKLRDNYTKAVEIRIETQVDVPLDGISYRSILAEQWLTAADLEIAAAFDRSRPEGEGPMAFNLAAFRLLGVATVSQVRNLLDKNWESLKAFVAEYRTLKTSKPESEGFPRGISLAHLVIMFLASRGEAEFTDALKELGATTGNSTPAAIVAMAERAMKSRHH
jgi:putative GTP pyrophosphokinase